MLKVKSVRGYIELESGEKVAFEIPASGDWNHWGASLSTLREIDTVMEAMAGAVFEEVFETDEEDR